MEFKNLDQVVLTWQQERELKLNTYIQIMKIKYGILEVTTDRQKANGTKVFQLPNGDMIASYKSGYVRRCNKYGRVYQLNKTYKQNQRYTTINNGELQTMKTVNVARELIHDPFARLLYIIEFCKRNYQLKNLTLLNI